MGSSDDAENRLMATLTSGDLAGAEKGIAEQPEISSDWHLLVYLLATTNGANDVAQRHLIAAAEQLTKGDYQERTVAAAALVALAPKRSTKRLSWAILRSSC